MSLKTTASGAVRSKLVHSCCLFAGLVEKQTDNEPGGV
jgi:hypothetical protein